MKNYILLTVIFVFSCSLNVISQNRADQLSGYSVIPLNSESGEFTPEFKEQLKQALQDVRIIALGEASHEDGATFEHKTRLVKFLHEELGYNVLAFEFGFYGHWKIDEKLKSGEEVKTATRYAGWAQSKQAYPVYEYIHQTKNTDSPLILAGFDSEKVPDGIPNISVLINETTELSEMNISNRDSLVLDSLITAVYGGLGNQMSKEITVPARNDAKSLLDSIAVHLQNRKQQLKDAISDEQYLMYQLVLKSVKMDEKTRFAGAYWNIVRDKHMAMRLQWLAEKVYKGEKIILWGATAHFARNMVSIDRALPPGSYGFYPYYQMGDWLQEFYGDQYYTLAFTTGSGQLGLILPDDHRYKKYEETRSVQPPKEGSLEAAALATGNETLLINLKSAPKDSWLYSEYTAYPLGYREDHAPWHQIIDGFYYIHKMYPDTMITMEDK